MIESGESNEIPFDAMAAEWHIAQRWATTPFTCSKLTFCAVAPTAAALLAGALAGAAATMKIAAKIFARKGEDDAVIVEANIL